MPATQYALFDTPLGRCGIAWTDRGIARTQFPEKDEERALRRLARGGATEADAPAPVAATIRDMVRHLGGQPQDFSGVELDLTGVADFPRRVYAATRAIEAGRTATYGEIAELAGSPGEARAVGRALGANPIPLIVPCHRVLASGGRMGGFSAPGGVVTKARLLAIEGVGLALDWA
jgi:methylated-DNA-[protein]-cysteine S-methyltransferase